MNEDLKPCPFCGSGKIFIDFAEAGAILAHCDDCGALGPQAFALTGAVAAWNARASGWMKLTDLPKCDMDVLICYTRSRRVTNARFDWKRSMFMCDKIVIAHKCILGWMPITLPDAEPGGEE